MDTQLDLSMEKHGHLGVTSRRDYKENHDDVLEKRRNTGYMFRKHVLWEVTNNLLGTWHSRSTRVEGFVVVFQNCSVLHQGEQMCAACFLAQRNRPI